MNQILKAKRELKKKKLKKSEYSKPISVVSTIVLVRAIFSERKKKNVKVTLG
jgi:hypothetical protein